MEGSNLLLRGGGGEQSLNHGEFIVKGPTAEFLLNCDPKGFLELTLNLNGARQEEPTSRHGLYT